MNVYLIERRDEPHLNEIFGFVIRAKCSRTARKIANKHANYEYKGTIWENSKMSSCKNIASNVRYTTSVLLTSRQGR